MKFITAITASVLLLLVSCGGLNQSSPSSQTTRGNQPSEVREAKSAVEQQNSDLDAGSSVDPLVDARNAVQIASKGAGGNHDNVQADSKVITESSTRGEEDTAPGPSAKGSSDKVASQPSNPIETPTPTASGQAPTPVGTTPDAPAKTTPPVVPTHVMQVSCGFTMTFGVTFAGKNPKTIVNAPMACAKLAVALNAKSFPIGTTKETTIGGPTTQASCTNSGALSFKVIEVSDGSSNNVSVTLDLEDGPVCHEIRSIINGLKI